MTHVLYVLTYQLNVMSHSQHRTSRTGEEFTDYYE